MHKFLMIDSTSTAEIAVESKTVADLTRNQQQKYAHLNGIYSDARAAFTLVQLIEPRGENSWKGVNDKIDKLLRADYKQQMYHDTLYDNFRINEVYESSDIIRIVGTVRRDMGLQTYLSSLKRNCESDFLSLFIVCTVSEEFNCIDDTPTGSMQKTVVFGYKPLFRLKPEDN